MVKKDNLAPIKVLFYLVKGVAKEEQSPQLTEAYWLPFSKADEASQGMPGFSLLKHTISKLSLIEEVASLSEAELVIAFASLNALKDALSLLRLWQQGTPSTIASEAHSDSLLRRYSIADEREIKPYRPVPILTIGTENIYAEVAKETDDTQGWQKKNRVEIERNNPCFRFFDSSIWHRYLSLHGETDFRERFTTLLTTIRGYYDQNLYQTIVANEALEFHGRLLRQSYVKSTPNGHSKAVTPFRFRSEGFFQARADQLAQELQGLQFGALMIDDYFQKPLRLQDAPLAPVAQEIFFKQSLLTRLINPPAGPPFLTILNQESPQQGQGFISYGVEMLRKYPQADVLILDYFMGIEEQNIYEKYGYQLIDRLIADFYENRPTAATAEEEKQRSEPGTVLSTCRPFDKFWILPISSFEYAWRSHLQTSGINRINALMNIGDISDPVSAPQFFRYVMFSFFKAIKMEEGLEGEALSQKLQELNFSVPRTKQHSLNKANPPKVNMSVIRKNVGRMFPVVAKLLANHTLLEQRRDQQSPSLFAKSYLSQYQQDDTFPLFCNHLNQLIYHISFGLNTNWPIMEEELRLAHKLWQDYRQSWGKSFKDGALFFQEMSYIIEAIKRA